MHVRVSYLLLYEYVYAAKPCYIELKVDKDSLSCYLRYCFSRLELMLIYELSKAQSARMFIFLNIMKNREFELMTGRIITYCKSF